MGFRNEWADLRGWDSVVCQRRRADSVETLEDQSASADRAACSFVFSRAQSRDRPVFQFRFDVPQRFQDRGTQTIEVERWRSRPLLCCGWKLQPPPR